MATIGGLIFLAFGAVALALVPTAELTCGRQPSAAPGCEVEWTVFFDRITIRHVVVRELRGVVAEELTGTPSKRGATRESNYQLTLSTESGELGLNLLGEFGPIVEARERVTEFLENGEQPELQLLVGPTGPFLWIRRVGTGIVLFGLAVLASVPLRLAGKLFWGLG